MGKRGQGGGGGGGKQVSNAKELKMFLKNRMWRDHWYVLVAVGVLVVALFGSAILQFFTAKDHMHHLEVTNDKLMHRVFRSGEPWVVLCAKPDDIIPEVYSKASTRLVDKSFVGVLDCSQKFSSSGKTVYARFGIRPSISPTVFTVANGEKPKQIFLDHLRSSKVLAKRVVEQTKKIAKEVQNSKQLEERCLQKPTCVLFLRGQKFSAYEKQWIDKLMSTRRTTAFIWVDSTILKLSIESMLPDFVPDEHRMVLFRRPRGDENPKTKAVTTMLAYENVFNSIPVSIFLKENWHRKLKPLSNAPTLSRRRKPSSKPVKPAGKKGLGQKRRKEQTEEEKRDDYDFPQAADNEDEVTTNDDDEAVELDDEEIVELDDEEIVELDDDDDEERV